MNSASRWRARSAGLIGVLAALAAILAPPPVSAAPAGSLAVSGLAASPGKVRFLLAARDLPLNSVLDPATVQVAVGDTRLPAAADRVDRSAGSSADLPPRAMMVVLDVSGSVAGARLEAARTAARALAAKLPDDVRLGLIAVTDSPRLLLAPTDNRAAFTRALDKLSAKGETALYDGVLLGRDALEKAGFGPTSDRRMLVLSDGADTASTAIRSQVTEALGASRLPTDVVAAQATDAGLRNLKAIAQAGGGNLLTAADNASLAQKFRVAASTFSVLLAVEAQVPNRLARQSGDLAVTVTVAGQPLAISVPVTFADPVPDPAAAAPSLAQTGLPAWAIWVVAGVSFVGLLLLVLLLAWPRSAATEDRIRQISQFGPARAEPSPATPETGPTFLTSSMLAASASVLRSRGLDARISLRLEQAGMRLRPHEWVLVQASAVVTGGALGVAVLGWFGLLLGVLLGWLGPRIYRSLRADRRTRQFVEQLPDALQLVTGSLRSGFSLGQSLDTVVREAPNPIAEEFGRALAEHRLGADLADALLRVADRTGSEDLKWVVMAIRIQHEVGGNLAEVLETTVDTMRERSRLRRHVRALSAEGRLSAWVLIGLPIVLGLFMFTIRGDYMHPLVTHPLGIALLLVGGFLMLVGIFWMVRVVKVEV
ncbi:type II secretion system F family protein [Micromonospora yasonensis]|uniref:type II secretion system F family protein n=1 Tax=Micromonospora yasonensis TaxID=1128667 RepID=UPI0022305E9C|nr:type II secretion system F family protein [Micromonospora yasonensis]MCW3843784.1 type II secretion system F family protein [Micromonospora yasonensis]